MKRIYCLYIILRVFQRCSLIGTVSDDYSNPFLPKGCCDLDPMMMARVKVYFTSSGVRISPLWKRTPSRMGKITSVLPSGCILISPLLTAADRPIPGTVAAKAIIPIRARQMHLICFIFIFPYKNSLFPLQPSRRKALHYPGMKYGKCQGLSKRLIQYKP